MWDGAIEIGSGRSVGPISESHGEIGAAVGPVSVIQKFSLCRLRRRNRRPQTTEEHLRNCKRARCDRHLLPTGSTGELMFIDDGIGACQKNRMGEQLDAHLEKGDNLERWTKGPKQGGLKMWEKRVLMTQIAGRACVGGDLLRGVARGASPMTSRRRRVASACS